MSVRLDPLAVSDAAEMAVVLADPELYAVAWVIGTAWQGRGIAAEASRQMLALLRERGVDRIEAHIEPRPHAVAARIGMTGTGELDNHGEQRWLA